MVLADRQRYFLGLPFGVGDAFSRGLCRCGVVVVRSLTIAVVSIDHWYGKNVLSMFCAQVRSNDGEQRGAKSQLTTYSLSRV
jgi:hypothetical protein